MKLTKRQLKEIIREEIKKLNKSQLKESAPKKGDTVSFTDGIKWFMTYVDSSHVKLDDRPNANTGSAMYHMGQLAKKPWYKDMEKWMDTGDAKFIDGKRY